MGRISLDFSTCIWRHIFDFGGCSWSWVERPLFSYYGTPHQLLRRADFAFIRRQLSGTHSSNPGRDMLLWLQSVLLGFRSGVRVLVNSLAVLGNCANIYQRQVIRRTDVSDPLSVRLTLSYRCWSISCSRESSESGWQRQFVFCCIYIRVQMGKQRSRGDHIPGPTASL